MTKTALTVECLDASTFEAWDHFVETAKEGTFFHRAGWKSVFERAFRHRCPYLYAWRGGRMEGVLPLVHVQSRLFTNALISTPFCVYGGVAAATEQAREALDRAACELARELGVEYLELRHTDTQHTNWPTKELYYTFRKEIHADADANFRAIPRKQRAMVRGGIKAGLESEIDAGVDRLYRAYSESVRNLGTPVFSKKYLQSLRDVFGRDCEVLIVTQEDRIIAGVMSFYFRDEVLPYYGGGTALARHCKGNDFMYWEVMRRAAERGVRVFDYGRSKAGTGSFNFKRHWGFEPRPLNYEYFLLENNAMPNLSPTNPRYQRMIALWKRLPLPLSRLIGPPLAKNLG